MTSNRGALGFDVGQEAVRREAGERAVSTGKATLTGRITPTRDGVQKALSLSLCMSLPLSLSLGLSRGRSRSL